MSSFIVRKMDPEMIRLFAKAAHAAGWGTVEAVRQYMADVIAGRVKLPRREQPKPDGLERRHIAPRVS